MQTVLTLHAALVLLVSSGALGTAYPPLVAVIMREKWTTRVKTVVSLVAIVAAAIATFVGTDSYHGLNEPTALAFLATLGVYVTAVWGSYAHLWQNLGVTQWIERAVVIGRSVDKVIAKLWTKATPAERAALVAIIQRETGTTTLDPAVPAPPV